MSSDLFPTIPEEFKIRVTFTSDWHVGSGAGRPGLIDRLIDRDEDDLPFVPAKSLTGIWRDACERVAVGLDEVIQDKSKNGSWAQWVNYLFGDQPARTEENQHSPERPRAATLSVRPLRLPASLRRRLKTRKVGLLHEALTFVQPGVKINPSTGRGEDQHLRFIEMARTGTILESTCQLRLLGPKHRHAATALLLAGAKLVERLGGKRRRGAGECQLQVLVNDHPITLKPVFAWLEKTSSPGIPPFDLPEKPSPTWKYEEDAWVRIPLQLECLTPLAVYARTVGNVVESLDFLPGTYLLRHVTQAFQGVCDVRSAIAAGDLCVLPAAVEINGIAGRPIPFTFHQRKEGNKPEKAVLYNRLQQPRNDQDPQEKPCRDGYLGTVTDLTAEWAKISRVVRTHNTVDDEKQKPTSDIGGVFSYEAIPAGTILRTELRLRQSLWKAAIDLKEKLSGEIRLGRSHKDDYGMVKIQAEELVPPFEPIQLSGKRLRVWALSDILLRDGQLRPEPTIEALCRALQDRLQIKLTVCPGKAFARVRRIESWQVGWGKPRPTLVALQAGSCVELEAFDPIDLQKLAQIEMSGLGERTAEGYGQLCFNPPLLDCQAITSLKLATRKPSKENALAKTDPMYKFAHQIETTAWREAIRRAALGFAGNAARRKEVLKWTGRQPSMSQLGGLREVVRQVIHSDDRKTIHAWLKQIEKNKSRSGRWPNGALTILGNLFGKDNNDNLVWTWLRSVDGVEWPELTENAAVDLQHELWSLAVRSVIDAAIRAHKRDQDHAAKKKGETHGSHH